MPHLSVGYKLFTLSHNIILTDLIDHLCDDTYSKLECLATCLLHLSALSTSESRERNLNSKMYVRCPNSFVSVNKTITWQCHSCLLFYCTHFVVTMASYLLVGLSF